MTLLEITLWSFVAAVAIGAMIAHWKWSNLKNAFSALADTRDGYKHRWKNAADGWREAEIARQMVRAEAALTDALDHRVTWSTCPVCGRLVACTGWPWSVGTCRHCNYIVAKSEVWPADPIKVEADHLAAAARLYQAGKQLHDVITDRPRVCIEQTQGEARLGRALDAAIEHWPDITGKDPRDRDPDGMPRSTGATPNPDQTPPAVDVQGKVDAAQYNATIKGELPWPTKPGMPDRLRHAFDGDPMTAIPTAKSRALRRAWSNLQAATDPAGHNKALLEYQDLHRQVHGGPDPNAKPWRTAPEPK